MSGIRLIYCKLFFSPGLRDGSGSCSRSNFVKAQFDQRVLFTKVGVDYIARLRVEEILGCDRV